MKATERLLAPSKWKAWEIALWVVIALVPVVFGQHAALEQDFKGLAARDAAQMFVVVSGKGDA